MPEIDAAFPGRRVARVTIILRGGRRLVHFQPDREGDTELPLDDDELEAKRLELAAPVIGQAVAQGLLVSIRALTDLPAPSVAPLS